MKIDIKNFYKNINLDSLVTKYKETSDLVCFLKCLGLNEFPIFQDCSGLSYIATRLFLEDVDTEILNYMKTIVDKPHLLRYSDDLYILFNRSYNLGNLANGKMQSFIKKELGDILAKYGLELNEKFSFEETAYLPQDVNTRLYDFYVSNEDFEMWEIIGEKDEIIRKIKTFISMLSQISTIEEYNGLLSTYFSYSDKKHKFEKIFFNEVLYNRRLSYILRCNDVVNVMEASNIIDNLRFDPVRITRLLLFSRCEQLIKKFLNIIYLKLENGMATQTDIVALLTYISQRNVKPLTRKKTINKLALYDGNLSSFLDRNL